MILRQEIFNRYVAQLQRIQIANTYTMYGQTANYLTNVGLRVYPWRTSVVTPEEAALGVLIPRDLDEPIIESDRSKRVLRQLHLQTEIVISGNDAADQLRQILADVEAAVGEGRETVWADITSNTRPRISRSVIEQESAKIAGGIFECFIDYPTLAFKSVI